LEIWKFVPKLFTYTNTDTLVHFVMGTNALVSALN
jgi:hypothetical protein